ncbi:hypothetical protein OA264_03570, partial [Alphaproteobacteria bacterium]|nr:hypothetical protein [Alphaproteobacteria bacterium]
TFFPIFIILAIHSAPIEAGKFLGGIAYLPSTRSKSAGFIGKKITFNNNSLGLKVSSNLHSLMNNSFSGTPIFLNTILKDIII